MNKRKKGRSLGREKDQKKALMRTLLVSLIESKKIVTTLAKAKELKPFAEKKLSLAKKGLAQKSDKNSAALRLLKKDLGVESIKELFLIAEVSKRAGGYTRIVKLMPRKSDFSEMAMIEWVDQPKQTEPKKEEKDKKDKKGASAKTSKDEKSSKEEKEVNKKK